MEIAALLNQAHSVAAASPSSSSSLTPKKLPPQAHQHRKSNSIVHVRENSLDELEALFDPSKRMTRLAPNLPPLHKRNLPSSFFTQPKSHKNHHLLSHHHHHHHGRQMSSIESSSNSSEASHNSMNHMHGAVNSYGMMGNASSANPVANAGISSGLLNANLQLSSHLRSMSEPVQMANMPGSPSSASMQAEALSHQQQQPLQQLHQNILNNNAANSGQANGQLPHGWQAARTAENRVYYIKYSFLASLVFLRFFFFEIGC